MLIVEDEKTMQRLLDIHLKKEGFDVLFADDGQEALTLLTEYHVDLALVDVMMPVMDGFEFVKELRRTSTLPVIFLTALSDEKDRIEGLTKGGDDYLVKPFSKGELIARIQAVLRRTNGLHKSAFETNQANHTIIIDGITVTPKARSVKVDDIMVSLTVKEFDLFFFLIQHQGQVFSREHLLTSIWGHEYEGTERTVDTHIKTLRMKLKPYGHLIQTVWGIGYKLVENE
ncbi:response regulator transcription factor [Alkalihalophilus lindianensis]|uniref:Response regulator transcription factor n=1 Tax=Alkalihalophilus lindianensis TaxID=1630542 RepID=A0ABU3X5P6_9BACI|nr:response regulator transcription factor [Alkalihalophilus lindianensis]MDV2683227.1 response regulator transcription factor [Alkalihalophilus lindianensis]